ILVHGVSLCIRGSGWLVTRLDTPPFSGRHHPDSAIALVDALSIEPHPSLSGEHHDFTLHDQHP
ncbi:hypothetical protein, partial [Bradyrhizobium sp. LeoA1S1]